MNIAIQETSIEPGLDLERGPCDAELAAIEDIEASERVQQNASDPMRVTLLELVEAVSDISETEAEIIATVTYMLGSGSGELTGAFRDQPIGTLLAAC